MNNKNILNHLLSIGIILLLVVFFFAPSIFENKTVNQGDIKNGIGISKILNDYKKKTGETAMWNPNVFGGMPAFISGSKFPDKPIKNTLFSSIGLFMDGPAKITFLACLFAYIMLTSFQVNFLVALLGAISFGFCSFNIISIEAGHNSKIATMAFVPLILAGIQYLNRNKTLLGIGILLVSFSFLFYTAHYQIIFYTALLLGLYYLIQLIYSWKSGQLKFYFKNLGIVTVIALLGILSNLGKIWTSQDYLPYSMRGQYILSTEKEHRAKSGLDYDYLFSWSNGIDEPLTLLYPHYYGGGSSAKIDYKKSDIFKFYLNEALRYKDPQIQNMMAQKGARSSYGLYWGNMSFTSGPMYASIIIIFLFLFSFLVLRGPVRIWLGLSFLFFLSLSWGKHFGLNYFLVDHLPLFNKFRTPSMAIIISILSAIFGASLALDKVLKSDNYNQFKKPIILSASIVIGLSIFMLLVGSSFSFEKDIEPYNFNKATGQYLVNNEADYLGEISRGYPPIKELGERALPILEEVRWTMFSKDVLKAILLIAIVAGLLLAMIQRILKPVVAIGLITAITVIDLLYLDRIYLDKASFVSKKDARRIPASPANTSILKDKDLHYRVYKEGNAYTDATTSYFHRSLGGYDPAKLRRIMDIETHIIRKADALPEYRKALDNYLRMMDTKYKIAYNGRAIPLKNHNGPAWFVDSIRYVNTPDEEINGLKNFDPRGTAIMLKNEFNTGKSTYNISGSSVTLNNYGPNKIEYTSKNKNEGLLVLSEVWYPKGWVATIDGKETPILRVNYVLRALEVPKGQHKITLEFKPKSYIVGGQISLYTTILLLLASAGCIGYYFYKENEKNKKNDSVQ